MARSSASTDVIEATEIPDEADTTIAIRPVHEELRDRAKQIASSDPLSAARALVELGLHAMYSPNQSATAAGVFQEALKQGPTLLPAIERSRRLATLSGDTKTALELIELELKESAENGRDDLLAERARMFAFANKEDLAIAGYQQVLTRSAAPPVALRGLEICLTQKATHNEPSAYKALAQHLQKQAAVATDSSRPGDRDVAWGARLFVEQGELCDRCGDSKGARAALSSAVELEPAPGPSRLAYHEHLVKHAAHEELATSLMDEAALEPDAHRAARLLLFSARLWLDVVGRIDLAEKVLREATQRAPSGSASEHRALADLGRLYETSNNDRAAAEVYERSLNTVLDEEARAHEHARLAELFENLGRFDKAADHGRQAVALRPTDVGARTRLDRLLRRLGANRERVGLWSSLEDVEVSNGDKIAGLRRAARILEGELGKREEALIYLRKAWVHDPGNGDVFDDLATLLQRRDQPAEFETVRPRIELYAEAARATKDLERRLALQDKLVAIWEDELGRPDRALELLEQMFEAAPQRRATILGMQRNAKRAGDYKVLAKALELEANMTTDQQTQRRLLLRAAEITEGQVGDRQRARALFDRAVAIDSNDVIARLTRVAHHQRSQHFDEARADLLAIIAVEPSPSMRAMFWLDVAVLDEHWRKQPQDAVQAYLSAAKELPELRTPRRSIARILRSQNDLPALVTALRTLAKVTPSLEDKIATILEASEVLEVCLKDDKAALSLLEEYGPEVAVDPAVGEARERILLRIRDARALAVALQRRIDRDPSPSVAERLRFQLARAVQSSQPQQATTLLVSLEKVAQLAPAVARMQTAIARIHGGNALSEALKKEALACKNTPLAAGVLWELAHQCNDVIRSTDALWDLFQLGCADNITLQNIVDQERVASAKDSRPDRLARMLAALDAYPSGADGNEDACRSLEAALVAETLGRSMNASDLRVRAHKLYERALHRWPESYLAARGLERTSMLVRDRDALRESQLALARLARTGPDRAKYFLNAASLVNDQETTGASTHRSLLEAALRVHPDNMVAAAQLAKLIPSDPAALALVFANALDMATEPKQIRLLGNELGLAIIRLAQSSAPIDPTMGVSAMRKVVTLFPDELDCRLMLARQLVLARAWPDAREQLMLVAASSDPVLRREALSDLANILAGPLTDPPQAIKTLLSLLEVAPDDATALERLQRLASTERNPKLVVFALRRLADTAPDSIKRTERLLQLADACRSENDVTGAENALIDAILASPTGAHPWHALRSLHRADGPDGAAALVHALERLLQQASLQKVPVEPRWLCTLGLLEISVLKRSTEGLAHLETAVSLPSATIDTKLALGRGLDAAGRSADAAQVIRDALTRQHDTFATAVDLVLGLETLDSALAKLGRTEDVLAVEELRACLGFVPPERVTALRGRPASTLLSAGSLAGEALHSVRVAEASDSLLDVGPVILPALAKILQFDIANLPVTSRDRIGHRDPSPVRALLDRLAHALSIEVGDLYLSSQWNGPVRAFPGDPPILIGPTALTALPELEQAFALAEQLARIALGTVGLDELPPGEADGLIIAAIRFAVPHFATGELSDAREQTAANYAGSMQRFLGRKQRKPLEDIATNVTVSVDLNAQLAASRKSAVRVAYLLTGSLISSVDYLRRTELSLAKATDARALVQDKLANELFRFSITTEATTHRRRIGTTWS